MNTSEERYHAGVADSKDSLRRVGSLVAKLSYCQLAPRLVGGGLNDLGEYQNHPDYQNDIEDHPNMEKYIKKSAVGKFIILFRFAHGSVHHQGS